MMIDNMKSFEEYMEVIGGVRSAVKTASTARDVTKVAREKINQYRKNQPNAGTKQPQPVTNKEEPAKSKVDTASIQKVAPQLQQFAGLIEKLKRDPQVWGIVQKLLS